MFSDPLTVAAQNHANIRSPDPSKGQADGWEIKKRGKVASSKFDSPMGWEDCAHLRTKLPRWVFDEVRYSLSVIATSEVLLRSHSLAANIQALCILIHTITTESMKLQSTCVIRHAWLLRFPPDASKQQFNDRAGPVNILY
jgi:hypothetical protein